MMGSLSAGSMEKHPCNGCTNQDFQMIRMRYSVLSAIPLYRQGVDGEYSSLNCGIQSVRNGIEANPLLKITFVVELRAWERWL